MKLDLAKAYDKVSWLCLRLILIKIGMTVKVVDWIMGCLSSTSFVVMINDSTSIIRGIGYECLMSPFLFLLVVEGLSRVVTTCKREGYIKGLDMGNSLSLSHLLFLDDVILFGLVLVIEVVKYKDMLEIYYKDTSNEVNIHKSSIIFNGLGKNQKDIVLRCYPLLQFPLKMD
jgi:hypothetical protein